MAAGRCRSCGAELTGGARFCSRCGAATDDVPVLDLAGDAPGPAPEPDDAAPRSRVARTLVVLVLAAVAVVILLSALADGDDATGDSGDQEGQAARSTTTTTEAPRAADAPSRPVSPDGVVAGHGLALIEVEGGSVTVLDPSSGRSIVRPAPAGADPEVAVAPGRLLVLHQNLLQALPLVDGGEWSTVALEGWRPTFLGQDGLVGLAGPDGITEAFALVGDDGLTVFPQRQGTGQLGWGALGVFDGAVVAGTADGAFLVTESGAARRVASGQPLAFAGSSLLLLRCDDEMRCGPAVADVVSGDTRDLPLFERSIVAASVSPDGAHVLVGSIAEWTSNDDVAVHVLDGDEWQDTGQVGAWHVGSAAWGDDGFLWWDPDRRRLYSVTVADGALPVSESIALGLPGRSATFAPIDALPESWRAELVG